MPIPDDFRDEIVAGQPEPFKYAEWLESQAEPELRDEILAGLDAGLSLEWAMLAGDTSAGTDPSDWNQLIIRFDHGAETWGVLVNDELIAEGIPVGADELIWDDIYYVGMDYGVDIEKEY